MTNFKFKFKQDDLLDFMDNKCFLIWIKSQMLTPLEGIEEEAQEN